MAYDIQLADKIRNHLVQFTKLGIHEKKMFGGLAFIINGKMCINVSGNNLMCRFDPNLTLDIAGRKGYLPMIMKGKATKGYCYVEPSGFKDKKNFEFWMNLCLDYNEKAKSKSK